MKERYRLRRINARSMETEPRSCDGDILWLDSEINTIGRNKTTVDLFIDSKKYRNLISRLHARIIRSKDSDKCQYEISDTSLNGTFINNYRVSGSEVLNDGDVIIFGHIRGATVCAGDYAPQSNAELQYQFERVPSVDESSEDENATSSCRNNLRHHVTEIASMKTPKSQVPSCFTTPPKTPGTLPNATMRVNVNIKNIGLDASLCDFDVNERTLVGLDLLESPSSPEIAAKRQKTSIDDIQDSISDDECLKALVASISNATTNESADSELFSIDFAAIEDEKHVSTMEHNKVARSVMEDPNIKSTEVFSSI